MAGRVIFHIDVNSAFLSWTAAYRCLVLGEKTDLREIPSVIAGHQNIRTPISSWPSRITTSTSPPRRR